MENTLDSDPFVATPSAAMMTATPAFALAAHQHPLTSFLLGPRARTLMDLSLGLGSPLHVVLPQVFADNVRSLQRVFTDMGQTATILFAKKANKAECFARICAELGIGIDIASAEELTKALAAGIRGTHIGVSGPEKSDHLLKIAMHHRCLIAVDSLDELRRIVSVSRCMRAAARVLLRCRPDHQATSRFGLTTSERDDAVTLCLHNRSAINLEGFAFHLSGYSSEERAHAASDMIDLCVTAQARGLKGCRRVNIGGGLPVQYVDPQQWIDFLRQNHPAHYHTGKAFAGFYPYGSPESGTQALRRILAQPVPGHVTLARKARSHGIEFIVEPGRALLDQAGLTIFQVQGVKDRHATEGYALVTVAGSSLSLSEQWFNSEYLPEPLLLPAAKPGIRPFLACVGGSTCLESDMLSWRKISFPRPIQAGDLLVYINTAGYQMDSNESPFHEVCLPHKVVIEVDASTTELLWRLDGL